jgi:D-alanine--D-alanine ligase
MKVAFTHNLRLTDVRHSEKEAEFDSVDTVNAIATALEAAGHEVEKVEVSGPASTLLERLEAIDPDLIFNTAEGQQGKLREALYPALFEELGIPYTGSDAYVNALTLDKWMTKLLVGRVGVDTPRACLVHPRNFDSVVERGPGLAFPVIVKPNHEGSSKGIYTGGPGAVGRDGSVVREPKDLAAVLKAALRAYPDGVLVEEYVEGTDVLVGYIEGVGHDSGILAPVELLLETSVERPYNVWDYRLKNLEPGKVSFRCPASIPRDIAARLRTISSEVIRTLGMRDIARLDFRVAPDGRIYFLEANAIPSLAPTAALFSATSQLGMGYGQTIASILNSAALRSGLATASQLGVTRRPGRSQPIRVGFTYNVKRDHDGDDEAEWDPPETIIAIANALARQGHIVVHLEATPDLPRVLAEADVDLIFNIAEGVEGRNREAQVPALCELLGVPYTGSDSATLAIALDKALAKKVLLQHDILTPKFQLMESPRERLSPDMKFPLIVKPNAEGLEQGHRRDQRGRHRGGAARGGQGLRRALPPAGADRGVHRRPRVHRRPARRQAPAGAAADGDQVQEGHRAAGLQLRGQAGVGGARLLRVPRQADRRRAEGDGEDRARDVLGARLPRRGARRRAHGRRWPHLRARGEPAARPDAWLLGPGADRPGDRHPVRPAHRRDHGGGLRRMREKRREERESDKKEAAKAASDVAAKYEKAADKVAADKTAKRMPRPPFEKPRDERRPAVRTDGAPLSQSSDGDSDRNVVAVPTPPPTTH